MSTHVIPFYIEDRKDIPKLYRLIEAVLMSTHIIPFYIEDRKDIPKLYPMINPQWLELPMPRTNLHGPKHVRVIEV